MRALIFILTIWSAATFADGFSWQVSKQWSPALEKKFSEFVSTMGQSGCRTLTACLTTASANPFYVARTPKQKFPADCADLPYALRMYFAWMEELPFDYVSSPRPANPREEPNSDIRYTKFGNKPGGRRAMQAGKTYDFSSEYTQMRNSVSTATYRMHFDEVTDFYPPALDPNGIRPGTVVYDPAGHAAIIFKIESDGRLRMMDAHPDNSITRITFDQKFERSRPAHGAGFKNWRPELNTAASSQLPGFSKEQYNSNYAIGGSPVSYYDYVRAKMSGGSLKFNPESEVKTMMSEICSNVHDREIAVNLAFTSHFNANAHPDKLPGNIYGTSGDWEEYSTPSRDARLKVAFVQLRKETERFIEMFRAGDKRISYQPTPSKYSQKCEAGNKTCFLVASLMSAYEQTANSDDCRFKYKKTNDQVRNFSYTDVAENLFLLSFDPYHCVELRWGESGNDLTSCADERYKRQWYDAEQGLRNQLERTYEKRMDLDLRGTEKELGVREAPDVDLWGYLNRKLVGAK